MAFNRLAVAMSAALACSAFAHVSLEQPAAAAGSAYKAVLRVGHGCDGSATTGITVTLPEGFRAAKPMPKPGWELAVQSAKLATPYDSHGRSVTHDVVSVRWSAATAQAALPDAHYDEFILRGTLPASAGPLWFKVLQQCEKGQHHWADVPASGTSTQGLASPAVLLQVAPAPAAAHAHAH